MGGLIIGVILILIGISALIGVSFFKFIFAIILIAIGIRVIVGRPMGGPGSWRWHHHDGDDPHRATCDDDRIDEVAVFSPLNKSFTSRHFKGGKIVAVFSGAEIDLTKAVTDATEIELEVSSVFGSVEITVPGDWKIKSAASVFLGNVDLHQAQRDGDGTGPVTLTIRGEAVFGEIEVRK